MKRVKKIITSVLVGTMMIALNCPLCQGHFELV